MRLYGGITFTEEQLLRLNKFSQDLARQVVGFSPVPELHYEKGEPFPTGWKNPIIGYESKVSLVSSNKTKCKYCGSWGDTYSSCLHCGATIDN